MKILKNYPPHCVALIALSILGEAVILVPYKPSDIYSFSAFLLAFLVAIPLFSLAPCLFKGGVKLLKSKRIAVKIFSSFLFSVVALLFLLSCVFPIIEFLKFSYEILLPKAAKITSLSLFLLALVPFLMFKKESLIKKLTGDGLNYFIKIFLPALAAIALSYGINPSLNKRTALLGVILGGLLLGGVFLTSLLILGNGVNHFEFPYLSGIGTLTFGNLFTRLDFFVYYLYFVSSLIKTAISIKSGIFIAGLLKNKKSP